MSFLFWIILGGIWIFYNCFKERKTDKTSREVVELTLLSLVVVAALLIIGFFIEVVVSLIPVEYDKLREITPLFIIGAVVIIGFRLLHNYEKKEKARYEELKRSNQEDNK